MRAAHENHTHRKQYKENIIIWDLLQHFARIILSVSAQFIYIYYSHSKLQTSYNFTCGARHFAAEQQQQRRKARKNLVYCTENIVSFRASQCIYDCLFSTLSANGCAHVFACAQHCGRSEAQTKQNKIYVRTERNEHIFLWLNAKIMDMWWGT